MGIIPADAGNGKAAQSKALWELSPLTRGTARRLWVSGVAGYVGSAVETAAVQSQVTSSPTVVSVDDPLAGHPLAACGADEAKQKENQK